MGQSAPVRKLAGAASAVLAQASSKLAGEPAATSVVAAADPAVVPKARAMALREAYSRAERRVDEAKEALAAAKADILEEMGAAEVLAVAETGLPIAELKTVTSLAFDSTRFRSENPVQAAAYMKEQVSRRFRVLA
jgi:hypothetical protein